MIQLFYRYVMFVVRFLDVMIRPCMWCFILFIFVKSHFPVNQCNQYIPESATWWLDCCNLIISVVFSRGLNSVPKSHAWQLSAIKGGSNISHVGFSLMFPNIQHALLQVQRARLMMDVIGLTCGCGSKKISMFYWDISGQVVELKKSSAGDGFLGAGWSVAGLKFDAGQGGGGGRSLLYISCIVPTNPPEQPAQCDVPRRSLKISTARTGPAEAVELGAQSSA